MRKLKWFLTRGAFLAFLAAALFLPNNVLAQDGDQVEDEDAGTYCDSTMAHYLVEELGFDCEELVDLGIGFGEIKKAWHLSLVLPGYEDNWEGLLLLKAEGQGWGSIKQAARVADGDPLLIEQYLELRQGAVGWGEIRHAQALADAGIYTFDEALALLQSGADWDELKSELDIEGPPPWAGGKNKPNKGQPPWAGGGKKGAGAS